MSHVTTRVCDRCRADLGSGGPALVLTAEFHHPQKLDLCEPCERAFTLWLGKHPLWKTTLANMQRGRHTGRGYPTDAELAQALGSTAEEAS